MGKRSSTLMMMLIIALGIIACDEQQPTTPASLPIPTATTGKISIEIPETSPTTTAVEVVTLTSTPNVSNDPTSTTTATPVSTEAHASIVLVSSTSTATPQASDTPAPESVVLTPAVPTLIPTATGVPFVQLLSPEYGEYRNPFVFKWAGSQNAAYQVTLKHKDQGTIHTSEWLVGFEWTYDIDEQQYGNWEWFVTSSLGVQSSIDSFVFDPFPVAPKSNPPVKNTPTPTIIVPPPPRR